VKGEKKKIREIRKAKNWAILNKTCNLQPVLDKKLKGNLRIE
jgi:hypothetical protein